MGKYEHFIINLNICLTSYSFKQAYLKIKIISIFLFFVILGLPIWKITTTTYRADIPFHIIDNVTSSPKAEWPIHIHFKEIIINSPQQINDKSILNLFKNKLESTAYSYVPKYKYHIDYNVIKYDNDDIPNEIDQLDDFLHKNFENSSHNGKYSIYLINSQVHKEKKVFIGKYRHACIYGHIGSTKEVLDISYTIINEILFSEINKKEAVKYAQKYKASFNLVNGNPDDYIVEWNFPEVYKTYLQPFIETFRPFVDLSVVSEVLYYAYPQLHPVKYNDVYVYKPDSLSYFIDPRWKIGTSQSKDEISLQFILYIPPKNISNLFIMNNNMKISETNGFVIFQWGGVVIHNVADISNSSRSQRILLDNESLKQDFSVFISQLRQLFGLKMKSYNNGEIKIEFLYPRGKGASQWEIDLLSRDRINDNIEETKSTLKSFSTMIKSLYYIPVYDDILNKLEKSINCMYNLTGKIYEGNYEDSLKISNEAIKYAEMVFFDENMVGILHSPNEHYFAVYFPFVGSVIVNLVIGLLKELKRKKNKKKN